MSDETKDDRDPAVLYAIAGMLILACILGLYAYTTILWGADVDDVRWLQGR